MGPEEVKALCSHQKDLQQATRRSPRAVFMEEEEVYSQNGSRIRRQSSARACYTEGGIHGDCKLSWLLVSLSLQ